MGSIRRISPRLETDVGSWEPLDHREEILPVIAVAMDEGQKLPDLSRRGESPINGAESAEVV